MSSYLACMSKQGAKSQAVAARILAQLESSEMSVNALAARTGIPRPTLNRHLRVTPGLLSLGQLEDIAGVLGVDLEVLFLAGAVAA
jgi:DNA-binding transcriptional ArsR family regulator